MNILTEVQWSPYIVGIGIGVLSWFTWIFSGKPIGCSTSFAKTAGLIEKFFGKGKMKNKLYYGEVVPSIDWQWMLVLGIIIGAFISSILSGSFNLQWIPNLWATKFGTNLIFRFVTALFGGILLGFGSRWADGCTSGHGISGTMLLSISSWISAICFFIGGIIAAHFIFNIL